MKKQPIETPEVTIEHNPSDGLPINDVPLLYSEQMVGLAVGSFVSKVVLAIENPPNQPIPKLTLVMPTQALHLMARQIMEILSSQETQDQLNNAFKSYQDSVRN